MKITLTATAVAVLCFCTTASAAGPEFKFSAFGTVGLTHSDTENADFISDVFQASGAGRTRSWSLAPDTKLGLQGAAAFGERWSAVLQVVSKKQFDDTYKPAVEWANVKLQVTPEISVRLGRIAAPSYLLSESRFVGYAMPWVRPPVEAYTVQAITSNDGVDASWRSRFGSVNNTLQAYYGTSRAKFPGGTEAKSDPAWGINNVAEIGSLTLRAGYTDVTLDLETSLVQPLFDGLQQFAAGAGAVPVPSFQSAAAQALGLVQKYKLDNRKIKALAMGASYDPGSWYLMSEWVLFKGAGLLSDSHSYYVSGGYRINSFTPYLTYASTKAKIQREAGIDTTGAPPLAPGAAGLTAGINATLDSFTPTQHTTSVGLRWDFMPNLALKAQYDRARTGDRSSGRLLTFPGLTPEKRYEVFTLAVDFVY